MVSWRLTAVVSLGGLLLVGLGSEVADAIGAFSASPSAAAMPIDLASDITPHAPPPVTAETGTILTRPLFNWNRQVSQIAGNIDGPLPRLSGIIVGAAGRYAIFAAPSGGKPQIIQEGGAIGRFTVNAIAADHVILKNGAG